MQVHRIGILVVAALLLPGSGAEAEQSWPEPVPEWWTQLEGGEQATYQVTMGQTKLKMVITITGIEGSKVTWSSQSFRNDQPMPPQEQTIDAAQPGATAPVLHPEAALKRGESRTIELGERSFACTAWTVQVRNLSSTYWVSPALPPVFQHGAVEVDSLMDMKLVSYDGPLLQQPEQKEEEE